jgi:pimeloyl-ACP methyl ester carboxylesterase
VVVGATYERIARSAAAKDYPPPGKLVDIGGRNIELDCRGQGTPTVVLVSGLDVGGSLSWTAVHDSIAITTRTCAYSRAGILWSDPGPAVTAKGVAEDLHAALEKGGEHAPFVMVGHSLGGPYLMTYTKYFGDQVAGVVFVDASHPDQVKRLSAIVPATADLPLTPLKIGSALSWTGLLRLQAVQGGKPMPNQPPEAVKAMRAYTPTSIAGALKEAEALNATFAEAGTFRTLGNRPLFVLTAMLPMTPAEIKQLKITEEKGKEFKNIWKSLHDDEASWSTRSQHVIVPDASHYIQFFRPDLVIGAVRSVVDSVRVGSK